MVSCEPVWKSGGQLDNHLPSNGNAWASNTWIHTAHCDSRAIPSSSTKQPPVNNGLYFKVAGFQKLPQTALACLKSLAKSSTKRETNFEHFESFNILHFGGPFRVVILLCTALRQCLEFKAWAVMEWCELRVSAVSASRCRCTVAQKQLLSADSVELVELRLWKFWRFWLPNSLHAALAVNAREFSNRSCEQLSHSFKAILSILGYAGYAGYACEQTQDLVIGDREQDLNTHFGCCITAEQSPSWNLCRNRWLVAHCLLTKCFWVIWPCLIHIPSKVTGLKAHPFCTALTPHVKAEDPDLRT